MKRCEKKLLYMWGSIECTHIFVLLETKNIKKHSFYQKGNNTVSSFLFVLFALLRFISPEKNVFSNSNIFLFASIASHSKSQQTICFLSRDFGWARRSSALQFSFDDMKFAQHRTRWKIITSRNEKIFIIENICAACLITRRFAYVFARLIHYVVENCMI